MEDEEEDDAEEEEEGGLAGGGGRGVPIVVSDSDDARNLRGLLKSPRSAEEAAAELDRKRKMVSFFDDVTVYLFDQVSRVSGQAERASAGPPWGERGFWQVLAYKMAARSVLIAAILVLVLLVLPPLLNILDCVPTQSSRLQHPSLPTRHTLPPGPGSVPVKQAL